MLFFNFFDNSLKYKLYYISIFSIKKYGISPMLNDILKLSNNFKFSK